MTRLISSDGRLLGTSGGGLWYAADAVDCDCSCELAPWYPDDPDPDCLESTTGATFLTTASGVLNVSMTSATTPISVNDNTTLDFFINAFFLPRIRVSWELTQSLNLGTPPLNTLRTSAVLSLSSFNSGATDPVLIGVNPNPSFPSIQIGTNTNSSSTEVSGWDYFTGELNAEVTSAVAGVSVEWDTQALTPETQPIPSTVSNGTASVVEGLFRPLRLCRHRIRFSPSLTMLKPVSGDSFGDAQLTYLIEAIYPQP